MLLRQRLCVSQNVRRRLRLCGRGHRRAGVFVFVLPRVVSEAAADDASFPRVLLGRMKRADATRHRQHGQQCENAEDDQHDGHRFLGGGHTLGSGCPAPG